MVHSKGVLVVGVFPLLFSDRSGRIMKFIELLFVVAGVFTLLIGLVSLKPRNRDPLRKPEFETWEPGSKK